MKRSGTLAQDYTPGARASRQRRSLCEEGAGRALGSSMTWYLQIAFASPQRSRECGSVDQRRKTRRADRCLGPLGLCRRSQTHRGAQTPPSGQTAESYLDPKKEEAKVGGSREKTLIDSATLPMRCKYASCHKKTSWKRGTEFPRTNWVTSRTSGRANCRGVALLLTDGRRPG